MGIPGRARGVQISDRDPLLLATRAPAATSRCRPCCDIGLNIDGVDGEWRSVGKGVVCAEFGVPGREIGVLGRLRRIPSECVRRGLRNEGGASEDAESEDAVDDWLSTLLPERLRGGQSKARKILTAAYWGCSPFAKRSRLNELCVRGRLELGAGPGMSSAVGSNAMEVMERGSRVMDPRREYDALRRVCGARLLKKLLALPPAPRGFVTGAATGTYSGMGGGSSFTVGKGFGELEYLFRVNGGGRVEKSA